MRAQTFLNTIHAAYGGNAANLNLPRAEDLAQVPGFRGGWEVWLQVEIAKAFMNHQANWTFERERYYPVGGVRCDFFMRRATPGSTADETWLELKCINPNATNPLNDAWQRLSNDIGKQQQLHAQDNTLNCISLLATFGTFNVASVGGPTPSLGWCWAGNRSAYVYDPANAAVTTLQNVSQGGNNRLFLVAVSV